MANIMIQRAIIKANIEREMMSIIPSFNSVRQEICDDIKKMSKSFETGIFFHPVWKRNKVYMINYPMNGGNDEVSLGYPVSKISQHQYQMFRQIFQLSENQVFDSLKKLMQISLARETLAKTLMEIDLEWNTHSKEHLKLLDKIYSNIKTQIVGKDEVVLRQEIFQEKDFLLDVAKVLLKYRLYTKLEIRLLELKRALENV